MCCCCCNDIQAFFRKSELLTANKESRKQFPQSSTLMNASECSNFRKCYDTFCFKNNSKVCQVDSQIGSIGFFYYCSQSAVHCVHVHVCIALQISLVFFIKSLFVLLFIYNSNLHAVCMYLKSKQSVPAQ